MLPFDLHVLSLPPAFNLSHDQTLHFKFLKLSFLALELLSLLLAWHSLIKLIFCFAQCTSECPHRLSRFVVKELFSFSLCLANDVHFKAYFFFVNTFFDFFHNSPFFVSPVYLRNDAQRCLQTHTSIFLWITPVFHNHFDEFAFPHCVLFLSLVFKGIIALHQALCKPEFI